MIESRKVLSKMMITNTNDLTPQTLSYSKNTIHFSKKHNTFYISKNRKINENTNLQDTQLIDIENNHIILENQERDSKLIDKENNQFILENQERDSQLIKKENNQIILENQEREKINDKTEEESKTIEKKEVSKEKEIVICLGVDGSEHSDIAFDIVIDDLMVYPNQKLFIINIYNIALDKNFNFRNKRDTIDFLYSTKILKKSLNKIFFIKENINQNSIVPFQQIHNFALKNNASFLISGYNSLRGQYGDDKERKKALNYILLNSRIPMILIKESSLRKYKKNNSLKWLFIFDRAYFNCYSIFQKFLPFINTEIDNVHALTLLPIWVSKDDNIKKSFMSDITKLGINHHDYECINYKKSASEQVIEKVNFGNLHYDYVVIYSNYEKFKIEGDQSDILKIIMDCSSNICILNGA